MRDLVGLLIKQHIEKITAMARAPLPHEPGGRAVAAPAARPGRPEGAGGAAAAADLITRNVVQVEFTSLPNVFRETLDSITGAPRLYVISAVHVKNELEKGPARGPELTTAGGRPNPPPPPASTPAADQNGVPVPPLPDKGPAPLRYVVGLEKVSVVLRIDLVKVAPPH